MTDQNQTGKIDVPVYLQTTLGAFQNFALAVSKVVAMLGAIEQQGMTLPFIPDVAHTRNRVEQGMDAFRTIPAPTATDDQEHIEAMALGMHLPPGVIPEVKTPKTVQGIQFVATNDAGERIDFAFGELDKADFVGMMLDGIPEDVFNQQVMHNAMANGLTNRAITAELVVRGQSDVVVLRKDSFLRVEDIGIITH